MPTINSFTVTPTSVVQGESVVVAWTTAGADLVTLNGDVVAENGSITEIPLSDKIYTLIATATPDNQSVSVTVTAPVPVDCVLSEWSAWVATSAWSPCVNSEQSRTEERTRTVITPPANGGVPCGSLVETRTAIQACVDEKIILLGAAGYIGAQYNSAPADRASLAVLQQAIADTPEWTVFADAEEHVSPSMNGVRPLSYVKMHPWGQMNGLYRRIPSLDEGQIYPPLINGFEDIMQSVFEVNQPSKPKYETKSGPRGVNVQTPYTTWHGHTRIRDDGTISTSPFIPQWVGVQFDGWICFLLRDGTFLKVRKLDARGASDYTFSNVNRKIFYVVDSLRGRILKVDRTPGIVTGQPENPDAWVVSTFVEGFVSPVSIREVNGLLYVTDKGDGSIWTVTLDGVKTKTKLKDEAGAFWIDGFSNGDLAVATLTGVVRRLSPAGAILQTWSTLASASTGWTTVSVDRNGTFGPADEFAVIVAVGMNNVSFWRMQGGVLKNTKDSVIEPTGGGAWGGWSSVGNTRWCHDPIGHYPWVAEHHPDEAILLVQGLANVFPSLIAARPANYPIEDTYNNTMFVRGREVMRYGMGPGHEYFTKPSFTAQIAEGGMSLVGCMADRIGRMTYADFHAFAQAGMLGSVPRPEIRGRAIQDLGYYLYRQSQEFLKVGKPLIDGWLAYCATMLGEEAPDITHRVPGALIDGAGVVLQQFSGDVQVDVVTEGSDWKLKFWQHPNQYLPATPDPALVMTIKVDEGFPEEQTLGTVSGPLWSMPAPTLSAGPHSRRAVNPTGVAPGKYWGRAGKV